MKIFDFDDSRNIVMINDFELITDNVMGGKSTGNLELIENEKKFIRLHGNVSTENNGGFIQFRSEIGVDDDLYKGLKIRVKGNKGKYFLHIRTPFTILPWQYYYHEFNVSEKWETIEVPLSRFKKSHFLQPSNFNSS